MGALSSVSRGSPQAPEPWGEEAASKGPGLGDPALADSPEGLEPQACWKRPRCSGPADLGVWRKAGPAAGLQGWAASRPGRPRCWAASRPCRTSAAARGTGLQAGQGPQARAGCAASAWGGPGGLLQRQPRPPGLLSPREVVPTLATRGRPSSTPSPGRVQTQNPGLWRSEGLGRACSCPQGRPSPPAGHGVPAWAHG